MNGARHSNEYSDDILFRAQRLWGEGLLSPGGPEELARLVDGCALDGKTVLDIGCGLGGVDRLLVKEHGVARVVGPDIEPRMIELATARTTDADLADRIEYRLVRPSPLEFNDGSFDVVFSYDAFIHMEDKAALFADVHDVLRPGGRLVVSDWLRGSNPDDSVSIRLWALQGLTVNPDTVEERKSALGTVGFVDVAVRDRSDHISEFLECDHERLEGPLRAEMIERVGEPRYRAGLEIRDVMHAAMAQRALCRSTSGLARRADECCARRRDSREPPLPLLVRGPLGLVPAPRVQARRALRRLRVPGRTGRQGLHRGATPRRRPPGADRGGNRPHREGARGVRRGPARRGEPHRLPRRTSRRRGHARGGHRPTLEGYRFGGARPGSGALSRPFALPCTARDAGGDRGGGPARRRRCYCAARVLPGARWRIAVRHAFPRGALR